MLLFSHRMSTHPVKGRIRAVPKSLLLRNLLWPGITTGKILSGWTEVDSSRSIVKNQLIGLILSFEHYCNVSSALSCRSVALFCNRRVPTSFQTFMLSFGSLIDDQHWTDTGMIRKLNFMPPLLHLYKSYSSVKCIEYVFHKPEVT